MELFENKVIPVDRMLRGEAIDFAEIKANAKESPGYFALELMALILMVIGTINLIDWAYRAGVSIGQSV